MAELWLIRHGETDWNREGRFQGIADIPLNSTGQEQARATAAALAQSGRTFNALYSSPLSRALQTAQATAQLINLPVRLDERLREINQGEWTGKNYRMVVSELGDPSKADGAFASIHSRAPGGESVAEVAARIASAASAIARAHPNETVLIFSHGLALATLKCQANGIPLDEVYDHIPKNGAATVVNWDG